MDSIDVIIEFFYGGNVDNTDLNMVRTFCVLYEQRGVTRAAEELNLTQPTVSYALKILRRQYRDELFIRSGRFLEPTDVARQLYPGLKGGLTQILAAGDRSSPFVPEEARQNFTLWLSDLGELAFLPQIMTALHRQAPHVKLTVEPLDVSRVAEALISGDIDAAILTPALESTAIERTVVYQDDYVVIASAHHPRIQGTLSLEQYGQETHVRMASDIGHDAPEVIADQAGIPRQDAVQLSRFAAVPMIVQETDFLAVLPHSVVRRSISRAQLQVLAYPLPISPMDVSLYHRPQNRQSEAQRWFSNCLKSALRTM